MNIFEKMSAITSDLKTVNKNLTVGRGNNKYKAVGERDILDAVKPLEEKHKVYSYPADREIVEMQTLHGESEYNGVVKHTTTFFSRMKTTYRFVNIEEPTEYIETTVYSEGIDSQDKGSGKAMTYADKYALMKAYKISTGDDPDQIPSEPNNYQRQNKPKPLICENCKKPIVPMKCNGKQYTVEDIAKNTKATYGKTLCWECSKLANEAKN